jgi:hypothetical protein
LAQALIYFVPISLETHEHNQVKNRRNLSAVLDLDNSAAVHSNGWIAATKTLLDLVSILESGANDALELDAFREIDQHENPCHRLENLCQGGSIIGSRYA